MLTHNQICEISTLSSLNFGRRPELILLPTGSLSKLFKTNYQFNSRKYSFICNNEIHLVAITVQEADIPKPKIIFTKSIN